MGFSGTLSALVSMLIHQAVGSFQPITFLCLRVLGSLPLSLICAAVFDEDSF